MRRLFRTLYWPLIIAAAISFGIYSRFWCALPIWTTSIESKGYELVTVIDENHREILQLQMEHIPFDELTDSDSKTQIWLQAINLDTGELNREKIFTRSHKGVLLDQSASSDLREFRRL